MARKNRGEHERFNKQRGWWGIAEYSGGKLYWRVSGLASRSEATVALARRILEKGRRHTDDVSIGEILSYYLDHRAPALANRQNALLFHEKLSPFWADKKLSDINQANLRAFMAHANETYREFQKKQGYAVIRDISASAVRRHMEHLRAAVNFALKNEIIKNAPHVPLPEKGKAKDRWLTRVEAARLLRASRTLRYGRTYVPAFIRIALRTGARKSAILRLRGHQIDIDNSLVDFRSPHDNKIKRAAVAPIFDRQKPWFQAIKKKTGIGHVIHYYGQPIKNIERGFKEACRIAGLENVSIHTLRHTFASWLKQDGASVSDVAEALGHTSTAMVDKTYAHMGDGYIQKLKKYR